MLYATLGEILTEKSGNLNLGVEGLMFMGAIGGLLGSYYYELTSLSPSAFITALIALLCAFTTAAFGATLYGILTIGLRANQNVSGLALSIFGTAFGNFFGEVLSISAGGYAAVGNVTKNAFNKGIGVLSELPYVGKILFSYNFLVYLAILLSLALAWFLKYSRTGLNLRAVGESPATADAAGINVSKYKYLATIIGGGLCGIGGLYIVMNSSNGVGGVWVHNCISGQGWIAVALVIFVTWNPARAILGSIGFGALSVMRLYIPLGISAQLYELFPYLATIAVLLVVSMKKGRKNTAPNSLGIAYYREER